MSRQYTVQDHDTLTAIARRFGLPGWRVIYDHPWNADLRARRPDPDRIWAGDVLYVPDPHEGGTRTLSFVRTAVHPITIEFIADTDGDHVVGNTEPALPFVRMGIWDQAFLPTGELRNGPAETDHFVGRDTRRFYIRVRDPAATGTWIDVQWRTLTASRANDDAPATSTLTLQQTARGSGVYVSRAVMLVNTDIDANQSTHSGLPIPLADANLRSRGQSNHRLRRARIDGFVQATYQPAAGAAVVATRPVFSRTPDERRTLTLRVINYDTSGTQAYLNGQVSRANDLWNAVGLRIVADAMVNRVMPAAAKDASGNYPGSIDAAVEMAALADLIPITPDNTLTVVLCPLVGSNAYATIGERLRSRLGNRYFIFLGVALSLEDLTLAHELHHVLFNRFDVASPDHNHSFNTRPPSAISTARGIALPDVRLYRRVHQLNAADPNLDAAAENTVNWYRRRRLTRHPALGSTAAADDTTGNLLVGAF